MTIVIAAGNDGEKGFGWVATHQSDSRRWDLLLSPRTESASVRATETTLCEMRKIAYPTSLRAEITRASGSKGMSRSLAA